MFVNGLNIEYFLLVLAQSSQGESLIGYSGHSEYIAQKRQTTPVNL